MRAGSPCAWPGGETIFAWIPIWSMPCPSEVRSVAGWVDSPPDLAAGCHASCNSLTPGSVCPAEKTLESTEVNEGRSESGVDFTLNCHAPYILCRDGLECFIYRRHQAQKAHPAHLLHSCAMCVLAPQPQGHTFGKNGDIWHSTSFCMHTVGTAAAKTCTRRHTCFSLSKSCCLLFPTIIHSHVS